MKTCLFMRLLSVTRVPFPHCSGKDINSGGVGGGEKQSPEWILRTYQGAAEMDSNKALEIVMKAYLVAGLCLVWEECLLRPALLSVPLLWSGLCRASFPSLSSLPLGSCSHHNWHNDEHSYHTGHGQKLSLWPNKKQITKQGEGAGNAHSAMILSPPSPSFLVVIYPIPQLSDLKTFTVVTEDQGQFQTKLPGKAETARKPLNSKNNAFSLKIKVATGVLSKPKKRNGFQCLQIQIQQND